MRDLICDVVNSPIPCLELRYAAIRWACIINGVGTYDKIVIENPKKIKEEVKKIKKIT